MTFQSRYFLLKNDCRTWRYVLSCKVKFFNSYSTSTGADYINVSFAEKYNSRIVEQGKYSRWETSGYFEPKSIDGNKSQEPFTMILPPPNITGTLHLGHALTITIQDILCRWKRMQGFPVLWIPGTDHAGIATHVVVERNISKSKGLPLRGIEKEYFMEELLRWKTEKENAINEQIKRLGASVDWSRYSFTLDRKQSEIVQQSIIKLFEDGLIHKKRAFVNWCCHLQTTVSDIEVDNLRIEGPTYLSLPSYEKPVQFGIIVEFAYKICDSEEEICVATTRLETMCGDVAIVINPNDARYSHLHGKSAWHPFRKCKLPIILDESANPEFGTGAFKLTPAHSKIDYEIAVRHNLPIVSVITESGHLNENCVEWKNVPKYAARELILQKLQELGLYKCTKSHVTHIPICNRSGDVIEYMLKDQWFLKCHDILQRAKDAIEKDDFQIKPKNMKNVILNWLKFDQDWCLSRQIHWGHKLPLFKTDNGWIAARSKEEALQKTEKISPQNCEEIVQENDVLDTWFSSALLPFSVFGWPKGENKDYQTYYPLSLMETGQDIACLWVARMIMLGLYFTGKLPFNNIVFHGLICDVHGRKMSKSLGNVIELNHVIDGISLKELNETVHANHRKGMLSDEELGKALSIQKSLFSDGIPECGADALRFTLVNHDFSESVIHFDVKECRRVTNFCNKMWQAFRFSITWANKFPSRISPFPNPSLPWHYWILHKLSTTVETCNEGLQEMNFHHATSSLKHFFVHDLCDFYLEASKIVFNDGNQSEAESTVSVLLFCLETYLRLLAPIMPYITEELYSYLPENNIQITETEYPESQDYRKWKNEKLEKEILFIRGLMSGIRVLQAEIGNFTDNEIVIVSGSENIIRKYLPVINGILRCSIHFQAEDSINEPAIANIIQNDTKIYLKLKTELKSLSNYSTLMESKVKRLFKKLNQLKDRTSTKKYIAKASEETKEYHRNKMKEIEDQINKIEELKMKICKFISSL
ncbi:valine--tRNA ligase-like [Planococcus citri]|uniref:valine--tRNA ligase-like n=1 Tax=Planococcus citri TaxID=170843 RepID=UPI0031F812AD